MKSAPKRIWIILAVLTCAGLLRATLPQITVGSWTATTALSQARSNSAAVMLPDGSVLFTGGDGANGPLQSAEVFGVNGTVSSAVAMNVARSRHFAVVLSDGRVLVGGGNTTGGGATNSAEIYDPNANTWTQTAPMTSARANATAALLQDGRILIAGGDNAGAPNNTLETYDPASGNFSFAGTLSSPRTQHAMSVLQDGRVLIVGGFDGNNPVASSDIFDPASGSVSAGPSLAAARYAASATTLMNGQVAVIGGAGQGSNGTVDLASIEIYDPTSGAFADAGVSLTTARQGHQSFLLPNNNNVLIVGGTASGAALASAELFTAQASTADGSWSYAVSATGSMITGRTSASGSANQTNGPTSTVTPKPGLVIVGGGADASGTTLASTEAYGYPTVQTDQGDYPPGSTVNIQGSGFKPGETVAITLVESPLIDTHGPYTVTADGNGNFSDSSFATDIHDLNVRFWLSAVGSQSGVVAQNTFTDSQPTQVTVTPTSVTVLPGQSAVYTTAVTMGGNTNTCTVTLSVSPNPVATGAAPAFSGGANPFNATNANFSRTLTISTTNTGPLSGRTQPGTYQFTATAGEASNCQGNTNNPPTTTGTLIVAGPAVDLQVTGYPSPTTAGITQSFTVTALDSNGNTAIGYTGTVQLTSTDGQAVLPANFTFTATDKGTHSFNGVLKTAGSQSITATDAVTSSITGTQSNITVNAAPTARLAVTGYPSPVTAGTSNSFAVTAEDAFGNLTTGYTGTVHFTSSDGAAVLPGNHNFTSGTGNKDNGVATFNATLNTAGTQSITATDTGTPSITGTQSAIVVNSATVATTLALAAASPASVQFGSTGPVTFSATLTRTTGGAAVSGATIAFTIDGNSAGSAVTNGSGVATFSTYNPSALSVASHNVQASFAGATISSTVYGASTSSTQTLAVTQAGQAITFGVLGNKIYGDPPFTVSATGGASGNPVTFTASPAGVCTSGGTNGSTITITGAGSCTVTAQQAGNTNYAAAPDVPQSFTVSPATPTITVTDPTPTYDGSPHAATATAVGVDGHTAVNGTFSFTYDGSGTAPTNAKTSYAVVAKFTSTDPNYANASGNGTLTIKQAASTTTVTGGTFTFDATPHAATVSVTGVGGLNLTPAPTYSGACSAAPVNVAETTPTACTASYTFAGDANHLSSSGSSTITIIKADSVTTVTVAGGVSFTYDGSGHPATVSVTGVGGLNLSPAPVYSCGHVPMDVADSGCVASYSYTGDANHNPSSDSKTYTIIKADSVTTVTVAGGVSFTYDGLGHPATASVTGVGGLNLSPAPVYSCGHVPMDVADSGCVASYSYTGDANHNPSSDSKTYTIIKADSVTTVTVAGGVSFTYDGLGHPATASVTGVGGLNLSPAPVYSCGHVPMDVADSGCVASYSYTGDANHNPSSDSKTYTIIKADSVTTVTVAGGVSFTYDGLGHPATASVTGVGGLNLSPAPVYSCGHVPMDVADSGCVASYSYTGDANHNPSSDSKTYTIIKADSVTTVTVAGGVSFTYDGLGHPATASVTGVGGLNLSPAPVYSCGHVPMDVADSGCVASYSYTGDANHNPSSDSKTYTIIKADSVTTVTVAGGVSFTYDGLGHPATASVTGVGGLNLSPAPVYSCGHVPMDVADSGCVASYSYTGDANHNPSSDSKTYTIIKAGSTTTIGNGFTVVFDGLPHVVSATVTGVGGLNQSVPVTYTPGGGTAPVNPGAYAASATYSGDANHLGSSAGPVTINITFGACSSGAGGVILPPINSDGTSVYNRKGGSTIPVKFRVCGANGMAISNANLVFAPTGGTITLLGAVRGTIDNVNESGTTDVPDVAFRWDASGQQWMFNMATSNLSSGSTYQFRINLAYAAQSILFVVGVK